MSPAEYKAVIHRIIEYVWNNGRANIRDDIIAPTVIEHRNDRTAVATGLGEKRISPNGTRALALSVSHVTISSPKATGSSRAALDCPGNRW